MSNRDQRPSAPDEEQTNEPSPLQTVSLADELTAVLKLIAAQGAETRVTEASVDCGDGAVQPRLDAHSLQNLDHSSAIDRLQDEIRALNERFADAGVSAANVVSHRSADAAGDEPWDRASAEALTQTYDIAFGLTFRDLPAGKTGAASSDKPAGAETADGRVDRDRLDQHLADIAARFESSLSEVGSKSRQFDWRLENLETRICQTLDELATRSDLGKLSSAQAQFDTMASQLSRVSDQLSRLDMIEGNLAAVLDRLSDRSFAAAPPSPEGHQIDFKVLAETMANTVMARLSEFGLARVDPAELAEIRRALDAMIEERRRHDEHQIAILDTLQQAMISVLDRVDALSQSLEQNGSLAAVPSVSPAPSESAAGDAEPSAASILPPERLDHSKGSGSAPATATSSLLTDWAGPDDGHAAPSYPQPPYLPLESDAIDSQLPSADTDKSSRSEEREEQWLSPINRIRDELIADAKRARQQASERAAKAAMAGGAKMKGPAAAQTSSPEATEPLTSDKRFIAGDTASKVSSRRMKGLPVHTGRSGIQRRNLLVGAVIILFAAAGALMMMRATSSVTNDAPGLVERPLEAEPRGAMGAPEPTMEGLGAPEHDGQSNTQEEQPERQSPGDSPGTESPSLNGGNAMGTETGQADAVPLQYDAPPLDPSRPLASNLHGLTGHSSSRLLARDQIFRPGDKQATASLSVAPGDAAALATPAALQAPAGAAAAASAASPAMASRTPLNLPPASVGPISLRLAAAKGDPSAEFEVGARMAEGKGTDQDFKEAARWFQRSATQGFAQAQYLLGTLYERGLGMPKDAARAAVWYQRAANNGNLKAMHNLAVLSASQGSEALDYAAAVRWFTAAAERGLADSQYNLAILYENGLGTAMDLKQAYMYFALAAQSGDLEAKRSQDALLKKLSAEELDAAKRMVQGWRRKPVDRLANDARVAGEDWKSRADNDYNR